MVKQRKRRNKRYSGIDSTVNRRPTITKITANNRPLLFQWIFEKRKTLKTALPIIPIVIIILITAAGIISLFQ